MTGGRIVRFLALATALALTGCRAWCERNYPAQGYYGGNCGCAPPPCCAPASNYPVAPQPCAPAPSGWNAPVH